MGKGGGSETTTTESEPWGPQQQYLQDVWSRAQGMADTPMQQYGGTTVGGQSAQTIESQQAGLGMIRNAGQGPMQGMINDVAGGRYLSPDSNPWIKGLADRGAADITRQFKQAAYPGASMGAMGRVGSGAESRNQRNAYYGLGQALQSNYANTYGQNYQMERGYMQQAPQMQAQYGADQRSQLGFGNMMGQGADQYAQRQLDDQVQKFNFGQMEPRQRQQDYTQQIMGGGVIPGTSTETQQWSAPGMSGGQWAGLGLGALSLFMGPGALFAAPAMAGSMMAGRR